MIDEAGGATSAQPARARARSLDVRMNAAGPVVRYGARSLVNFCSNDYLGLAAHPAVREAAVRAVAHYGVGAGSAALLGGWTEAHREFALRIARYLRRDRALLFSSGYLANLGTLASFAGRHDEIFHDKLNHASLIDGVRLSTARSTRYRHGDPEDLARRLAASTAAHRIVVTDGVFSMDGDCAPIAALARLARAHDALLVCDDAHGFGVLGGGRGLLAECGLTQDDVPLLVVTFGKALGVSGAAVVGREDLIEALLQRARTFIYDTAMPPALPAACSAALDLIESDAALVARLQANIAHFRAALLDAGLTRPASTTAIQPIVLGDDARALAAAAALEAAGYYVRAVRPPTVPEGSSRLRVCLSAAHEPAQIDGLVGALVEALARLPAVSA
ncbi:MAG TPA: 8-amino-7-oxononanoate synthase [Gammaproteobacteria bacterium]|nr:8-amino-7-oxononanoate synthase [Gammaproteobacteria bacterium]